MKISKHKINNKKIFELHLIKSRTYENVIKKKNLKNLPEKSLFNIMVNLKKSLNIIFKYHKNNKRILFVGVPKKIEKNINLKTIHTALPNNLNIKNQFIPNNFILNNIQLSKYLFKEKKLVLSKMFKTPELIILFKHPKQQHIVKTSKRMKIPLIEFDSSLDRNNWEYSYNVPSSLKKTSGKNFNNIFFIILNSLLNKSYKKQTNVSKKTKI